ncbi:hypothetical protein MRX96_043236 [Rhipicephalus microplus]
MDRRTERTRSPRRDAESLERAAGGGRGDAGEDKRRRRWRAKCGVLGAPSRGLPLGFSVNSGSTQQRLSALPHRRLGAAPGNLSLIETRRRPPLIGMQQRLSLSLGA